MTSQVPLTPYDYVTKLDGLIHWTSRQQEVFIKLLGQQMEHKFQVKAQTHMYLCLWHRF